MFIKNVNHFHNHSQSYVIVIVDLVIQFVISFFNLSF
jgi:hypothetical protein